MSALLLAKWTNEDLMKEYECTSRQLKRLRKELFTTADKRLNYGNEERQHQAHEAKLNKSNQRTNKRK